MSTWSLGPIMLLHGTDDASAASILADGVNLAMCSPLTDFGRGFYTTTHYDQAVNWAILRAKRVRPSRAGTKGVVLGMTVDRCWLGELDSLVFLRPAPETGFADFVRYCRAGLSPHRPSGNYEIAYGPVAQWQDLSDPATKLFVISDCDQVSFHEPAHVATSSPLFADTRELWRES